jgi:membrane protein DedA with SNARE-associated domain
VRDLNLLLQQYGYVAIFAAVLLEQAGLPLPAAPLLLAVGALAGAAHLSAAFSVVLAIAAALIGDTVWYLLGRRKGNAILRLLCRISLEPDSCVSFTKTWFRKLGAGALIVAKFVPGLSTAAPPMAGMTHMPAWRFLLADALGAALWAGAFIGIGLAFSSQIEAVAGMAARLGSGLGILLLCALALYIVFKLWQRERFLRKVRMSRITADELLAKMDRGEQITVIDLRHPLELGVEPMRIKGAVWYERGALEQRHSEIPRDRDIVVYCT